MFCYCKTNVTVFFFLSFNSWKLHACQQLILLTNSLLITLWNFQPRFLASYIQIFNQDLLQYAWKNSNKISNKLHFRKFSQNFLQSSHMENFQPRFLCKLQFKKKFQKFLATYMKNFQNKAFFTSFLKTPTIVLMISFT